MKRSMIRTLSAAIFSLALVQAAPLYADHELSHKKGCCMIKQIDKIKETLNLSPEQEASLKMIKAKSQVFMKMRHTELKSIYEEGNKLAQNKTIDKLKLDILADKRCKLSRETIKHHVFLKHEIYQILDLKQRQKLQEKMHGKD
jgi:Spy/CpxP family protein refolding chaperone